MPYLVGEYYRFLGDIFFRFSLGELFGTLGGFFFIFLMRCRFGKRNECTRRRTISGSYLLGLYWFFYGCTKAV